MLSKIKFFIPVFLMAVIFKVNATEGFSYQEEAKKVVSVVVEQMKSDYSVTSKIQEECFSKATDKKPEQLEKVRVIFYAEGDGSIEEAREMEIKAIQQLVQLINGNEKLRPYLSEAPFPTNRIEVSIDFFKGNPDPEHSANIGLMRATHVNGIMQYTNFDTGRFVPFYSENYEKALANQSTTSGIHMVCSEKVKKNKSS